MNTAPTDDRMIHRADHAAAATGAFLEDLLALGEGLPAWQRSNLFDHVDGARSTRKDPTRGARILKGMAASAQADLKPRYMAAATLCLRGGAW